MWNSTLQCYVPTKLGKACLASNLKPEAALYVYHGLAQARKELVLRDDLHIIFQLTPVFHSITPIWSKYYDGTTSHPISAISFLSLAPALKQQPPASQQQRCDV